MLRGNSPIPNVPSYQPPFARTQAGGGQQPQVSFRVATTRRTQLSIVDTNVIAVASKPISWPLDGTGFLEYIDLDVNAVVPSTNSATVAFAADAPWNALNNITLKANGPELFNLDGYSLYLLNLYGGFGLVDPSGSSDTQVYAKVTGSGATGGNFRAKVRIPLALNSRSLMGIVGNQDRQTKYELRTDLNASGQVYTTAPTALPNVTITRTLGYCTLPPAMSAEGKPQNTLPPFFGVYHYANVLTSESQPVSASSKNHFIRGLGNMARLYILQFYDSAGARSDLMLPTGIQFKVGQDVWFNETSDERRAIMRNRYGFDSPAGVLVYDFVSDFGRFSGFEYGNDFFNTRNVSEAQFSMTYPTFANTPGNLKIITDSLMVPDTMNVLAYT